VLPGYSDRLLAFLLRQQAALGSAHTPPAVAHGILEARTNIFRIKASLHKAGIIVDDLPDDEESSQLLAQENIQSDFREDISTSNSEKSFDYKRFTLIYAIWINRTLTLSRYYWCSNNNYEIV
jgi:hypothetical protein